MDDPVISVVRHSSRASSTSCTSSAGGAEAKSSKASSVSGSSSTRRQHDPYAPLPASPATASPRQLPSKSRSTSTGGSFFDKASGALYEGPPRGDVQPYGLYAEAERAVDVGPLFINAAGQDAHALFSSSSSASSTHSKARQSSSSSEQLQKTRVPRTDDNDDPLGGGRPEVDYRSNKRQPPPGPKGVTPTTVASPPVTAGYLLDCLRSVCADHGFILNEAPFAAILEGEGDDHASESGSDSREGTKRRKRSSESSTVVSMCAPGWSLSLYDADVRKHFTVDSTNVAITAGLLKYVEFYRRFGCQTRFRFQICRRFSAQGSQCKAGNECQYIHCTRLPRPTNVHVNENAATSNPSAVVTPAMLAGGINRLQYPTLAAGLVFSIFPPNSNNAQNNQQSPQYVASDQVLQTAGAMQLLTAHRNQLGLTQRPMVDRTVFVPGGAGQNKLTVRTPATPPPAEGHVRPRHCAHFQFRRLCHLGGECNFIHSLVPFVQGVTYAPALHRAHDGQSSRHHRHHHHHHQHHHNHHHHQQHHHLHHHQQHHSHYHHVHNSNHLNHHNGNHAPAQHAHFQDMSFLQPFHQPFNNLQRPPPLQYTPQYTTPTPPVIQGFTPVTTLFQPPPLAHDQLPPPPIGMASSMSLSSSMQTTHPFAHSPPPSLATTPHHQSNAPARFRDDTHRV